MALEEKVSLLSKLTTTVAGLTTERIEERRDVKTIPDYQEDPSEDESEESEGESECEIECEIDVLREPEPLVKTMILTVNSLPSFMDFKPESMDISEVIEPEILPSIELNTLDVVDPDLPKRIVSEDNVKTLSVDLSYEDMSVKDLKEKVAEMNGPKLKTKKELLEFLKNKI